MKTTFVTLSLFTLCLIFSNCQQPTEKATPTAIKDPQVDMSARNKATFIKVNALYNEKKLDEALKFYGDNYERNGDKNALGPAAVKARWDATFKQWPDHKGIIEHIIAEGDWVMLRGKATGTHTEVVMGVKPTNKKMDVAFWESLRFDKDGMIVESWSTTDYFAMMQQLGLIPAAK
jgi:predicted ester cyclase